MRRLHLPSTVASPVIMTGLALFCLVTLGACYAYVPMIGEEPTPGDQVRLRLSGSAATEVSERVGRPIRAVEGPLLDATPDSLRVDVGWGAVYAGTVFEGRRDTLQFARAQVLEVDRRQFSRTRTGLVGAALVAGVVALIQSISGGGDGAPDPGDGDPTFGFPGGRR